jgi:hypothetical protein
MSLSDDLIYLARLVMGQPTTQDLIERLKEAAPNAALEQTAWVDPAGVARAREIMRDPKSASALDEFEKATAIPDNELRGRRPVKKGWKL